MRKLGLFGICFILFLSFVSANPHYGINYNLYGGNTLVEINFGEVSDFEFQLPYDAKAVEVNMEGYELIDTEDGPLLKIGSSSNLQVNYVTGSLIEKTSSRNLFIVVNNFEHPLSVVLSLPEGGIVDDLVVPEADSITTDGRNIYLSWFNFTQEEIVVAYKKPSNVNMTYIFGLLFLILLFVAYFAYASIKFKKKFKKVSKPKKVRRSPTKIKKEVTRNLYGEEKKIVEYLMDRKGKESWTKEMVRDLDISKVRLSRRLRSLVQRGLIEKVPYGNENRIKLLKKS